MINELEKEFLKTQYKQQETEDWRKDLAYKKFEYQKQKDNARNNDKIQKEAEKIAKQEYIKQQQTQDLIFTILQVLGKIAVFFIVVVAIMTFAPVLFGFMFLFGLISGLAKIK